MPKQRLKSLQKNWQSWALAIGIIGVAWLAYALFLQRPQGVEVGEELLEGIPACEARFSHERNHYRAAHFKLYYYNEGCAGLPGSIAIETLKLIESYDDNLAALGLPRVQSDTAALLLPGVKWRVLGTPGVGRGLIIGAPPRSEYFENVGRVGMPLAAAMIEEAAPGIADSDRDELAMALAAAVSPESAGWFELINPRLHPGAKLYGHLIGEGEWGKIKAALDKCRDKCDFQRLLQQELS